jgi:hypothetical protein
VRTRPRSVSSSPSTSKPLTRPASSPTPSDGRPAAAAAPPSRPRATS